MNNLIKKILTSIIAFTMLCSCSATKNEVDNITETKPAEDSRYLLFSTQAGGEYSHWSFESIYKGFFDSAAKSGIEVKKLVFSDVRKESGMQGMYAHFCDPLQEELQKERAKGIFSLNVPVGAFPYYKRYTDGFPTMIYLRDNINSTMGPPTADTLCYPISGVEQSQIITDYIMDNYEENTIIGSIWNAGAKNSTAYGDREFLEILKGKAELVEPLYFGNAKSSDEYALNAENYCKDNDIDVLVATSVVAVENLANCDVDIIYCGTNEEAVECVKTGEIKAVICTDPYAVGEIAYTNLMKIINGEEFEKEICIEPLIIDTAEEAEDFLERNLKDYPPAS